MLEEVVKSLFAGFMTMVWAIVGLIGVCAALLLIIAYLLIARN
jgi:hypothetical protein